MSRDQLWPLALPRPGRLKTGGIPVLATTAGHRVRSMAVRPASGRALLRNCDTRCGIRGNRRGTAMTTRPTSRGVVPTSGRCKAGVSFAALAGRGARDSLGFSGTRLRNTPEPEPVQTIRGDPRAWPVEQCPARYCPAPQSPIRRRRQGNEGRKAGVLAARGSASA